MSTISNDPANYSSRGIVARAKSSAETKPCYSKEAVLYCLENANPNGYVDFSLAAAFDKERSNRKVGTPV